MKVSHYTKLLVFSSVAWLCGCSGEQQTIAQDQSTSEILKLNQTKLYGAWQSADKSYGFEFVASPTQVGNMVSGIDYQEPHFQPEGKIYQQDQISAYFTWSLLGNGMVRLDIKNPTCQPRPLTFCATHSVQMLEVLGNDEKNLRFKVAVDTDLDGYSESNYDWQLTKKSLPTLDVGDRSYLLETLHRGYNQAIVEQDGQQLTVKIPVSGVEALFTETSRDQYSIGFTQVEPIKSTREFYVYNHGDTDIDIISDYEYMTIYPAFNDSLNISYKINRSFETPDGIAQTDIDLDGFMVNLRRSKNVTLVNAGQYVPDIEYGKAYYGSFEQVFDIEGLDDGMANELVFIDNHSAVLRTMDVLTNGILKEQVFSWQQGQHLGEFIFESDRVIYTLEFLFGEQGRYRTVASTYNKEDEEYSINKASEYFFAQNDNLQLSSLLPYEFEFTHLNGVTTSPVELLDDGEVELVNVDEVNGGRWFFESDDVLVRFECLTEVEIEILDYQTCLDSFSHVGTTDMPTSYSHISRLKFLNKIGDDYLVRYDAVFWGGEWGRQQYVRRFSSYYQWIHLVN